MHSRSCCFFLPSRCGRRRSEAMSHYTEDAGPPRVGVLVVDDQLVFRHVARDVVDAASPEFVLLGEAASGPHALAVMDDLRPDLVLVDIRMAGMDGIETSRRLRAAYPEAVVVLVTIEDLLNLPSDVGFCGAADIVRKQDFRPALLRRLWRAHGSQHL
jgi:two-component system, NarL family, invasion response regulator UvrY